MCTGKKTLIILIMAKVVSTNLENIHLENQFPDASSLLHTSYSSTNKEHQSTRRERFLSIFSLVRFRNGPCDANGDEGTCYTGLECRNRGGTIIGTCAFGFGSCCVDEITCGGTTSTNGTYLISPNYPSTYNQERSCVMTVTRQSDICQLRLDFVAFQMSQPDDFGVCQNDQFTVDGERKFTYLCGNSPTNWHFYLDVNGEANPTTFRFNSGSASFDRRFKIKVSMIECSQKIPSGCGQYFRGNSGTIQSFNYGGIYLAGMNYGICTRQEQGKCTTTLTRAGRSFIQCSADTYRQPIGNPPQVVNPASPFSFLNRFVPFCQIDTAVAFLQPIFAPVSDLQPTVTTVTNGPLALWHSSAIDAARNYNFARSDRTWAGFYQTFSHNNC